MLNILKTKTLYPVSLNEVKQHLRIDLNNNEDDDYISKIIIPAATRKAENFIARDIALTTTVYTVYNFYDNTLTIPEGGLNSITSIKDGNDNLYSYSYLEKYDDRFYIELSSHISADTLILTYITGYNDADLVPEEIKFAILIECGNLFDVERSSYTQSSIKKSDVFERLLMFHKNIYW